MTIEIMLVLAILVITVVLLLTEKLRVDVIAVLIMVALVAFGLLSPSDAVAGFSNQGKVPSHGNSPATGTWGAARRRKLGFSSGLMALW